MPAEFCVLEARLDLVWICKKVSVGLVFVVCNALASRFAICKAGLCFGCLQVFVSWVSFGFESLSFAVSTSLCV